MNWNTLTHGPNGFLLGLGLVLVPLWIGLAQGRAPLRAWVLSPLSAVLFLLLGGLLNRVGHAFLTAPWMPDSLTTAAAIGGYLPTGYAGGRYLAARPRSGEVRKRGARLEEACGRLTRQRATRDAITLASIEIPNLGETKHFKVIGTTGTGKSTAIREILRTALARGDRAVIADPDGAYLEHFYDPRRGDEILNPFDPRSVQWDLFAELRAPYDIDRLARALIADSPDVASREWRGYARTFLSSLLRSHGVAASHCVGTSSKNPPPGSSSVPAPPSPHAPRGPSTGTSAPHSTAASPRTAASAKSARSEADLGPNASPSPADPSSGSAPSPASAGLPPIAELWRQLMSASTEELRELLAGTPAQAFLAPGNEKMFGSMRSVAITACAALEHIAAERATPFSVRSWIHPGCTGAPGSGSRSSKR